MEQGLYLGSYTTPRIGAYELEVAEAQCCGLFAELYNNRWLQLLSPPRFNKVPWLKKGPTSLILILLGPGGVPFTLGDFWGGEPFINKGFRLR